MDFVYIAGLLALAGAPFLLIHLCGRLAPPRRERP